MQHERDTKNGTVAGDAAVVARAVFLGFLPLVAVNAFFVRRVHGTLSLPQSVAHHLYDAGQILGLGVAAWVVFRLLWRLPGWLRAAVGFGVACGASYALLGSDLESFLERIPKSTVPWRWVFAAGSATAIAASVAVACWFSRSWLRYLGLLGGLAVAVGHHLVLQLAYPGAHFVLACCAACVIGLSALPWVSRMRTTRALRWTAVAAGVGALLSYVVVPGPVVRGALLGSSGAVAAPFISRGWAHFRNDGAASGNLLDPAWLKARQAGEPVPPTLLEGRPDAPIVVMLTIDALRGDLLEDPAYKKSFRNLLAMEKQSLRFARAWSPAAYTMASLRSFFSGVYYSQQGLQSRAKGKKKKKGEKPAYLAQVLTRGGVKTVNLRAHEVLGRDKGVAPGFEEEEKLAKAAPSETVVAKVLERLGKAPRGPLFIYGHILDAHAPYDRGGKKGSAKARYVAELARVDDAIGKLRRELAKRKLDGSTYLILSADHGEAFGEHGHFFHATTVYEEMIRVPLIIEGPGVKPRRVDRAASLIDVGPTLLSLFWLETPGHFMGESLVPFMRGEDRPFTRPLAVDGGRAIRAMLFGERWKAIVDERHGTEELYDLEEDPGEQRNLAEQPYAQPYLSTLRAFFKESWTAKPPATK